MNFSFMLLIKKISLERAVSEGVYFLSKKT